MRLPEKTYAFGQNVRVDATVQCCMCDNIEPLACRDNRAFRSCMAALICADHLGKLVRLLRTLGFDTLWCASGREADIVEAVAAGRVFVTRDQSWKEKTLPGQKLIISSSDPYAQLREVIAALKLKVIQDALFKRCRECNAATEPVAKEAIATRLPPYVRKTIDSFRECPGCHRLYWDGTHVTAMAERLRQEKIL